MTEPRCRRLGVVFCQYDQRRYPGALSRLTAALESLGPIDQALVVVDNAREGDWSEEVASGRWHIGGDNRDWEFSAFDRGLAHLESRRTECDLVLLVTDAFSAYGSGFLELVDTQALGCARELRACVGWVDSFMEPLELMGLAYDSWLRTSFLLAPLPVLRRLGPLAVPIDSERMFGSPRSPFAPGAPVSANLRARIVEWLTGERGSSTDLDEVWHSHFDLTDANFDFFKRKASAILREHLLSARLKDLSEPCYDLRTLHAWRRRAIDPRRLTPEESRRWQWLGWLRSGGNAA